VKRGQAIVETLFAVLAISFLFFGALRISRMLAARTVLDHAAARAARAKSVGFNSFMCMKTARAAMIPVAGERLWPEYGGFDEAARVPQYLASEDEGMANGILEYERWHTTRIDVSSDAGLAPVAECRIDMQADDFEMTGRASVESHYPLYMFEQGR
jgi:hypothetical protein